jgi:hypothetical protein
MSAAADAIRALVAGLFPTGWRIQFGRWMDADKSHRYVVIRPAGGATAEVLRRPQFTVAVIGGAGDASTVAGAAADQIVTAMRAGSGDLVHMDAGEPVFMATDDGRTVFEIAVSTITD